MLAAGSHSRYNLVHCLCTLVTGVAACWKYDCGKVGHLHSACLPQQPTLLHICICMVQCCLHHSAPNLVKKIVDYTSSQNNTLMVHFHLQDTPAYVSHCCHRRRQGLASLKLCEQYRWACGYQIQHSNVIMLITCCVTQVVMERQRDERQGRDRSHQDKYDSWVPDRDPWGPDRWSQGQSRSHYSSKLQAPVKMTFSHLHLHLVC